MPPRPSLWRISYLPILRLAGAIIAASALRAGRPPAACVRAGHCASRTASSMSERHVYTVLFEDVIHQRRAAPSRAATPAPLFRRKALCEIHGRDAPESARPRRRNRGWYCRPGRHFRRRGIRFRSPRPKFPYRRFPLPNYSARLPAESGVCASRQNPEAAAAARLSRLPRSPPARCQRRGPQTSLARHAAAQGDAVLERAPVRDTRPRLLPPCRRPAPRPCAGRNP